jgi:hypothetical protein
LFGSIVNLTQQPTVNQETLMRTLLALLATLAFCQTSIAQVPGAAAANEAIAENQSSSMTVGAAVAAAVSTTSPLISNTLYMCEFKSNSQLFKVNAITAQVTVVGLMQTSERCTDLAFRKTTAAGTELFGTSFTRAYKIAPTTGKATLLPNIYGSGITDINALVAQPGSGKLYGAGSTAPGKFVDINPVTGKATVKGSYGTGLASAGDLTFLNGQLYGLLTKSGYGTRTFLAKISLVSTTFGKASNLLPIRRDLNGSLIQLNDVWGLVARSGVLIAAMRGGELITINASTGIAALKGDNNKVQAGLALSP